MPLDTARDGQRRARGWQRVIAVGTTVVRALETVTDADGTTHPGEGWTRLVITPERGMRARGWAADRPARAARHPPGHARGTGRPTAPAREPTREALRERYLWHEFGDLHLILP